MKEFNISFTITFTITFLLCSGILFSVGIISVRVSILIAYVLLLLSLILGLIVISRLFILQWKLQGENKMIEKELEKVKDVNDVELPYDCKKDANKGDIRHWD